MGVVQAPPVLGVEPGSEGRGSPGFFEWYRADVSMQEFEAGHRNVDNVKRLIEKLSSSIGPMHSCGARAIDRGGLPLGSEPRFLL